MSEISQRKSQHIEVCLNGEDVDRQSNQWNDIKLTHRALPELDFNAVDTSTEFLGKTLAFPFLISSMTGGRSGNLAKINQRLAEAAEICGVAMAVGSQRVQMEDDGAENSFSLRQFAPTTVLIGNVGAVQLNYGFGIKECEKAVKTLQADGLYFHLNPLQEIIQTAGDVDFSDLASKIKAISNELSVPLLVKEVGAGLSTKDVEKLIDANVAVIDFAGTGGTSWSRVESHRSPENESLGILFQDWGISTVDCLKQNHHLCTEQTFIASGGLRNGLDLAKSIILGAKLGGFALPLLEPATISTDAVVTKINQIKKEFQTAMFLLGCKTVDELFNNSSLITNF